MVNIRKPYDEHTRNGIVFDLPSLTKQAFAEDSDINNIMKKFHKTGLMEHLNIHHGEYGDFSEVPDYHSALNQLIEADNAFNSLPADLRKRFDNNAGLFLDFVHDPDNGAEMVEMGLAHRSLEHPGPGGLRETQPEHAIAEVLPEPSPPTDGD